jgi:hypothetical protein
MSTLTIRLPEDQHERLRDLARRRGISLNKLFEEFAYKALAEADTQTRFAIRASRGNAKHGLDILRKLDSAYSER